MAGITGDSPQAVAYAMMEAIAIREGKPIGDPNKGPDKAWILATYKECIHVVLDVRKWGAFP